MEEWVYPVNENKTDSWGYDQGVLELFGGRASAGVHRWYLGSCFNLVTSGDRIWVYAVAPLSRIVAAGTVLTEPSQSAEDGAWYIDVRFDRKVTRKLLADPPPADTLEIRTQTVRRMRPTESKRLVKFMANQPEPEPAVRRRAPAKSTGKPRPPALDEETMRADDSKRLRYERLLDSPFFMDVVEANRVYLAATVADARGTERDSWALSCLPGSRHTLSRISMGGMETFVIREPEDATATEIEGLVIVARSVIEAEFGSLDGFRGQYPALTVEVSGYRDAGDDQVRVRGGRGDLVAALWADRFAAAAQALAESLMQKYTPYARGHNYQLADHVLGRA